MSKPRAQRTDGIRDFRGLLDRCKPNAETGCHIWAGAVRVGTGRVWIPTHGNVSLPMAFAILKTGGTPAPKGSMWVPRCGNTLCCTPSHRFLGTTSDLFKIWRPKLDAAHRANLQAAIRRSTRSKFDERIKADILASDETGRKLAKRLGLSQSQVSRVRRGTRWGDVQASSVFSWRGPSNG